MDETQNQARIYKLTKKFIFLNLFEEIKEKEIQYITEYQIIQIWNY